MRVVRKVKFLSHPFFVVALCAPFRMRDLARTEICFLGERKSNFRMDFGHAYSLFHP